MSILEFEMISNGLQSIVEDANENRSDSELYRVSMLPLACFTEMMTPNGSLKYHELAARAINLVVASCRMIITRDDAFISTPLYQRCQLFVVDLAKVIGLELNNITVECWLKDMKEPLPAD